MREKSVASVREYIGLGWAGELTVGVVESGQAWGWVGFGLMVSFLILFLGTKVSPYPPALPLRLVLEGLSSKPSKRRFFSL